jgi:hypothetical protein
MKIDPVAFGFFPYGQTVVTELIVACRNFSNANAHKNGEHSHLGSL